jgi:hypothetical protein
MESDRNLLGLCALASVLLLAACGDGGRPAEEAPPPAETVQIDPLTDVELMGIPREQIVLTLPWSDAPVSRDPAQNAARATVLAVEVTGGEGFDRAAFEFGTDTDYPGYRVAWNDSTAAACGDEGVAKPAGTLLIRLEPATTAAEGGGRPLGETSRRPELPAVTTARQLCDENQEVVWALEADSTRFRVVELRDPPRLLVDVLHGGGASAPSTAPPGR